VIGSAITRPETITARFVQAANVFKMSSRAELAD